MANLRLNVIQSNGKNIHKALLVGVAHVAKTSYLSGFNNLVVHPMSTTIFSDKFGFTEKEVGILLQHHQKAEDMKGVKEWYGGYGATDSISLYNPWSVNRFIQ